MKIGIDARPLTKESTGIGVYLQNALDALSSLDHQYYLISSDTICYETNYSNWTKIEGHINKHLLGSAWMQANVPLIVRRFGLEAYWGTRHHLPLLLAAEVNTVLTIHDVVHRMFPETMALRTLMLERLLMRTSVAKAGCIFADSLSTLNDLNRFYPLSRSKSKVLYPGTPTFQPENCAEELEMLDIPQRFVLFVGTLEPRKNLMRILGAYGQSRPESHHVGLVIVGAQGWKTGRFGDLINRSSLSRYVRSLGYVTRSQLAQLYRRALCVLLPSIYEGFGFPILEAMSFGTPVITSRASSMQEVAGEASLLVDPYNVNDICEALLKVIGNEALRNDLARKGLERSREFSWDNYARELVTQFGAKP
jgi:glycosyltransferase involved in cell wall biosynthesis